MKQASRRFILVNALLLSVAQTVQAGSISCGVHIVQDGERNSPTKYEVLKKCGEPKYREGNSWIYSKGGRDIEVFFKDGKVEAIR